MGLLFAALIVATLSAAGGAWAQSGNKPPVSKGEPSSGKPIEPGQAQDPFSPASQGFTYQGRLRDGGSPANEQYDLQFTLYDAVTGGNQAGSPITVISQTVSDGLFTVQLDFGAGAFQGSDRWLEIGVRPGGTSGAFTTLSPRQALTAAPYAMSLVPGAVITDTSSTTLLSVNNGGTGTGLYGVTAGGANNAGLFGESVGQDSNGVVGKANNGPLSYGVWGLSDNGYGAVGQTITGTGVYGQSTHGDGTVGTSTASGKSGVYGYNDSAGGVGVSGRSANGIGVQGTSTNYLGGRFTSNGNVGVWGQSNSWYGGYFTSTTGIAGYFTSTGNDGVHASTGSASSSAVYGSTGAANGQAIVADANNGSNAKAIWGRATLGYGVYGQSTSGSGTGVYGEALGIDGIGLDGVANSGANARGVVGYSTNGVGIAGGSTNGIAGLFNSVGKDGVQGHTNSTFSGVAGFNDGSGPGIYGTSTGGYAGQFQGNVEVAGTLHATVKNFKIDDPLDPEHKYLYHTSVESSDMLDIYRGHVNLDANGEAWVQMPAWFEALNRDFDYQLTPIGAPAPNLYIGQKVQNNRFKISGGKAGMEVSWQVTGVRHDPYAQAHPSPVEQSKPAAEQGTYLFPELYNQPASKGVSTLYARPADTGRRPQAQTGLPGSK